MKSVFGSYKHEDKKWKDKAYKWATEVAWRQRKNNE